MSRMITGGLPASAASMRTSYTRPRSTTLMPSSGSTTSRMASSTSSREGKVVVSLMRVSFLRSGHRALHGHPAEQRALDAGRVLRHALERHGVVELVGIRLGQVGLPLRLHEVQELLLQGQRLVDRSS